MPGSILGSSGTVLPLQSPLPSAPQHPRCPETRCLRTREASLGIENGEKRLSLLHFSLARDCWEAGPSGNVFSPLAWSWAV